MQAINTALCSMGMSGTLFHAPFLSVSPKFNLYGVWERTNTIADKKYPGIKTFRTLEALLADDRIELVVVNTPSITHFDFAKKVISAGKHLVVEKPFTPTVAEAEELIRLAEEKQVKLSVYHNRRYDSDFRTLRKILDEGLLGKLIEAEFHFDRFVPELSKKAHKEAPTPGVGTLYDLGSHLIDQALVLFGMPKAVFGDLAINRPGSRVVDYFDLKLFYDWGRVILKSNYFVREALPGYVLHGSKGSFIKAKTDVQENCLLAGKMPGTADWGTEPEQEQGLLHTEKDGKLIKKYLPSLRGNYMDYYDAIYEALRNDKPVPVSGAEGMRVIKLIEAAMLSHELRKVIDL